MKRIRRIICSSFLCAALVGSTCIVSAEKGFEESMAVKEIISFVGYEADAGQPYQIIRLKEKIAEAEIAFPQTLTVNLAGKTEPETLAVSWQTAEDYANSTYDTYIFTPVWDTSEYELAFENDMSPFIEVQITQGIEENLTNTINNTYSNVITLGTGETYANFSALFNEPSIQGDVVVSLTSDIKETRNANEGPLVIPDRFTSLIIQSDNEGIQRAFSINEEIDDVTDELRSLYANGRSLIISKDIVFSSPMSSEFNIGNYPASIYGGGYNADVTGDTSIEFNGVLERGNIFGGGFNSNVDGDTKVTIGGEVYGIVAGGGYAEAGENDKTALTLNANVSGSATINITNASQYVKYVRGGGVAYQANAKNVTGKHVLNANVDKDVKITIDGVIANYDFAIIGGGYAECEPLYEFQAELQANVSGDIELNFEGNAKGDSSNHFGVYGGGYAKSIASTNINSRNVTATALVLGNTEINAVKDVINLNRQSKSQTFRCLYGGGYASGLSADATVTGDTIIRTARPVFESKSGVFGGGYAVSSGTADVKGTTHITIQPILNQSSSYQNANGVFGGGHAVGNYDPAISGQTFKPSQANVGNTEITIKKGAIMAAGNTSPGASLVGGGFADGDERNINNDCPEITKVLGNVKITIEDEITLASAFIGGGTVISAGDASVGGFIDIKLGDNCKINKTYQGGGLTKPGIQSSYFSPVIKADVTGDIRAEFGNNIYFNEIFIGGGYANLSDSSVNVGGKIKSKFLGGATIASAYVAAGCVFTSASNAEANVLGGLDILINGNFNVQSYYGAGRALGSYSSADIGKSGSPVTVVTKFLGSGDNTIVSTNSLFNGGYAKNLAHANIYGDVSLICDGTRPVKLLIGGGYSKDAVANIYGSVNLSFSNFNSALEKNIYSGGYAADYGESKINGNVVAEYKNMTIDTLVGAGGYIENDGSESFVDIEGNSTLVFSKIKASALDLLSGGIGAEAEVKAKITGTCYIKLEGENEITGTFASGGYSFSEANQVEYHITGIQNLPIQFNGVYKNCLVNNGIYVYIGDGSEVTEVDSYFLSAINSIIIAKNATLNLADEPLTSGAVNTNHLFWGVKNLTIQEGGKLSLVNSSSTKMQEAISNEYIGNGTLVLEAGKSLSIGGTAAGTTQLEIQGSPAKDQVYVTVANGGSEVFNYTSDSLNLNKEESGNTHTWKLVEAEIPVNSISGITEGKEYFKGDTLAFTAFGNGMENNTPSLNNKRWLPSKCLIDTAEINLDSAYSGTINTANLSTGAHKLSITFTEQRYDGSDWSNTGRDDIKEVTFTLKEKSNTPSSGGGSYAPSTKKEGFVENSGKTYYYINGKPADNGFILLDKDQQLVQALSPDQFIQKPTTADAVYYIKEDRTIAKNEWVVLDQNGNFVDTMPLNEFKDSYGEEYKLYAAREDGQLVQSWLEVNGVWFYFLEDYSARYQYWQAHWNDWYLFEHYTYVTNRWQPTSEGRWYYLDSEGRMVRNQWIDGCWIDEYGIYWSPIYTPENE